MESGPRPGIERIQRSSCPMSCPIGLRPFSLWYTLDKSSSICLETFFVVQPIDRSVTMDAKGIITYCIICLGRHYPWAAPIYFPLG